jgi:UDP-3-O-[3-hydroxymyristoyl] glucosamine N-acyltransferase
MPRKTGAEFTVRELAERLGCAFEGDGGVRIKGVASLEQAGAGDLVFLAGPKLRPKLDASGASAAIVPEGAEGESGGKRRIPVIRAADPHLCFARAAGLFYEPLRPAIGVHPTAVVAASARIGEGASVGALASVGEDVEIGAGAVIHPLVSIYPGVKIGEGSVIHSHVSIREGVVIGKRVTIHNGCVIGADGFGYIKGPDGRHVKVPQVGGVIIEDDVEIGANTAIDRAALDATIIRKGVKIDDLVMVGHNVEVGENAILVAQVGISGSSRVGRGAILSGQVGIADHVSIGDGAIAAAKSGVTKDVPAGAMVSGSPHLDIREWRKFWAAAPRLYDLIKEFKRLKARVEELEKK